MWGSFHHVFAIRSESGFFWINLDFIGFPWILLDFHSLRWSRCGVHFIMFLQSEWEQGEPKLNLLTRMAFSLAANKGGFSEIEKGEIWFDTCCSPNTGFDQPVQGHKTQLKLGEAKLNSIRNIYMWWQNDFSTLCPSWKKYYNSKRDFDISKLS